MHLYTVFYERSKEAKVAGHKGDVGEASVLVKIMKISAEIVFVFACRRSSKVTSRQNVGRLFVFSGVTS